MQINELATPAIVLDLDRLEHNIERYHKAAIHAGKAIWPMTKTHKSIEIAELQLKFGASGFLCGTLDECEAFCNLGVPIMYAYPPAGARSIERILELAKKCAFIVRLDGIEAATALNDAAARAGIVIDYTLIVDSGLHRFGVEPSNAPRLLHKLMEFKNLSWKGISTHPGQVYGAAKPGEVGRYIEEERSAGSETAEALKNAGLVPEIFSSGSTPTHMAMCAESSYNMLHPGNYVFCDAIQMSIGVAKEEDCALTVLATVIAHPTEDRYIIDAGAKCLGLDQGAHGCASVKGYGHIVGHPELSIHALSEEVGKIHVEGETSIHVGDQISIIPNHACSNANCTSFYMTVRGKNVINTITVDARGNCRKRV